MTQHKTFPSQDSTDWDEETISFWSLVNSLMKFVKTDAYENFL